MPAHWEGGARARKNVSAAKKSFCPSEDGSTGGSRGECRAIPSEKIEASPVALLGQSKAQQKSFLFLLPARRSLSASGEKKKSGARKMKRAKSIFLWCGERNERLWDWLP